jgi:hypothetical protein
MKDPWPTPLENHISILKINFSGGSQAWRVKDERPMWPTPMENHISILKINFSGGSQAWRVKDEIPMGPLHWRSCDGS